MVRLFLSEPSSSGDRDPVAVKERICLLERAESVVWSVIMASGGRHEARLWLCSTISSVRLISAHHQRDLFVGVLKSGASKREVATQLFQMIFERSPEKAGRIIAKKRSRILESFFEGSPRRILEWFDNFAEFGESGHKKGARALTQFAFVNRDLCWEELEWKGRHGQSPAVVATKPHYFHDLDVLKTIENFLEYVPDFWTSDELAESVKDGEILRVDTRYFVDRFVEFLYEESMEDIWELIDEFLMDQPFSFLCQHLLILLDEDRTFGFLKSIIPYVSPDMCLKDFGYPSSWLEYLLTVSQDGFTMNELYLLNAIISYRRPLLRLFEDEENEAEKASLSEMFRLDRKFSDVDHWSLMNECLKIPKKRAIKLFGLQSWVIMFCLSHECKDPQSLESLFSENGICFRVSDPHAINNQCFSTNAFKKRKRVRVQGKGKFSYSEPNDFDMEEFEESFRAQTLPLEERSWLLSTDGYLWKWHAADLPEHLSKYCFLTWMDWFRLNC